LLDADFKLFNCTTIVYDTFKVNKQSFVCYSNTTFSSVWKIFFVLKSICFCYVWKRATVSSKIWKKMFTHFWGGHWFEKNKNCSHIFWCFFWRGQKLQIHLSPFNSEMDLMKERVWDETKIELQHFIMKWVSGKNIQSTQNTFFKLCF
jgi:hypothetical protein